MQSGLDKWILEFETKDPTINPMGWEIFIMINGILAIEYQ